MDLEASNAKVAALLKPRNIVIVGASEREGSWPATVWKTVQRYGFEGPIYPLNPNRETIFGAPCYPDFEALPEKPDHLVLLVRSAFVPDTLRRAAAAGARSATIYSAGFGETGTEEGRELGRQLAEVIAETGIAVSGPNCTGNISAAHGLVTMVDHRVLKIAPGPVALVGQSGGVMLYANHILADRGLQIGYLISSGNEADLSCADYIAYLAQDPAIKVIFCYAESIKDPERFKAACAAAQAANKPVVVFKVGVSAEGRQAAMTHTGALAGSAEVFDAVAGERGVIRVDSLDDAIEAIELAVHAGVPLGKRVAALSLSGAYCGILLDAAAGSEIVFPPLAEATEAKLKELLQTGSSVGNPADGGFSVLTDADAYAKAIEALCQDPGIDVVLLQAELPRETGMAANWEERFQSIDDLAANYGKKILVVSMYSRNFTDYTRELRARYSHTAFVQESRKTVRAISHLIRWSQRAARAQSGNSSAETAKAAPDIAARLQAEAKAAGGSLPLSEPRSKELLRAYGIETPREQLVSNLAEAKAAAREIGYPVVLKAAAASLLHKSDLGAVAVGLADDAELERAYGGIEANLARGGFNDPLEGMLVCELCKGEIELVLGVTRDPEMGLVAMVGGGGVLLELVKDVAFAGLPMSRESAAEALARTRVSKLLEGYRGGAKLEPEKVVDALLALGRMAGDLGERLESIDINPLVGTADGRLLALDGLVVLRGEDA
ncbi:MAG: acetate--CoA ligase family protein [Rhodovibrionaceae bacterium]